VFCGHGALNSYIKQSRFFFKGLIVCANMFNCFDPPAQYVKSSFIALHGRMFCIHTNHRFPLQSPPLSLAIS